MTVDAWDPKTFGDEISEMLTVKSRLIFDYHSEDRRLMNEHIQSNPYESLKTNHLSSAYQEFKENELAPVIARTRIRTWHYTRLTDEEADAMFGRLVPSSPEHLCTRLNSLVTSNLLTQEDADTVFSQSPIHTQGNRAGCLCASILPLSPNDHGVKPLLENWGGESAYFGLSDKRLAETLKGIGTPRIIQIETALTDGFNGFKVAETFLAAWARQLGAPAALSGCDLFIRECISSARVLHVHTMGDSSFGAIGSTYPERVGLILAAESAA